MESAYNELLNNVIITSGIINISHSDLLCGAIRVDNIELMKILIKKELMLI